MQDSKPYFTKSNYAPVAGFLPLRLARLFSKSISVAAVLGFLPSRFALRIFAPVDGLRPLRFALLKIIRSLFTGANGYFHFFLFHFSFFYWLS
jgi:hypothetical protein